MLEVAIGIDLEWPYEHHYDVVRGILDYGKENKALEQKMKVYRKELPFIEYEIEDRAMGLKGNRKYKDLSDADLKQKAEQIRAQWTKDINKYRDNETAAQKQSERLFNNVIVSKKPNTFQPKGFNTKGAPIRPTKAWKKGTEAKESTGYMGKRRTI